MPPLSQLMGCTISTPIHSNKKTRTNLMQCLFKKIFAFSYVWQNKKKKRRSNDDYIHGLKKKKKKKKKKKIPIKSMAYFFRGIQGVWQGYLNNNFQCLNTITSVICISTTLKQRYQKSLTKRVIFFFMTELWVVRDGLSLCLQRNYHAVDLELDAKAILDVLTNPSQSNIVISTILDDYKLLTTQIF